MPTQFHLPTPPSNAQEINDVVAIVRERGQVAYFASGVPVFAHAEDDAAGRSIPAVHVSELGLAREDPTRAPAPITRAPLTPPPAKHPPRGASGDSHPRARPLVP